MQANLTVGALARAANVTTKTVRYYDALGLLPPAVRGANGYRYYPAASIGRLQFIKRAQRFGLSLEEISQVMELSEEGRCDVISPALRRLLDQKIAECDRQLAELTDFRRMLSLAVERIAPYAEDAGCGDGTSCSSYASDCDCLTIPTLEIAQASP
jgi:DNA-binding transcriptional MerR regulator